MYDFRPIQLFIGSPHLTNRLWMFLLIAKFYNTKINHNSNVYDFATLSFIVGEKITSQLSPFAFNNELASLFHLNPHRGGTRSKKDQSFAPKLQMKHPATIYALCRRTFSKSTQRPLNQHKGTEYFKTSCQRELWYISPQMVKESLRRWPRCPRSGKCPSLYVPVQLLNPHWCEKSTPKRVGRPRWRFGIYKTHKALKNHFPCNWTRGLLTRRRAQCSADRVNIRAIVFIGGKWVMGFRQGSQCEITRKQRVLLSHYTGGLVGG